MTIGNTSALDMALRMFTQSEDYVLSDEYTFATAVETAKPMGVQFVGMKMDKAGMCPDNLREILDGWDPKAHGGSRRPFVLYLIPTGQNPTGATQGLARRREIYKVAQDYDLIILEDDPYYFMQMDPYSPAGTADSAKSRRCFNPGSRRSESVGAIQTSRRALGPRRLFSMAHAYPRGVYRST